MAMSSGRWLMVSAIGEKYHRSFFPYPHIFLWVSVGIHPSVFRQVCPDEGNEKGKKIKNPDPGITGFSCGIDIQDKQSR
jgi:hypothetical protein